MPLQAPKTSTRRRYCSCLFLTPGQHQKLYSDKVFDFCDWEWHRNAAWRHRLEPRTFCLVALGFAWQLLHVILVSIMVGLYHELAVPMGAPKASVQLTQAFGMITFCLSLLLVFRTNSSYARWWEARTLWGSVVNLSRNYARQMMIWAPPQRAHIARLAARWMIVAVHVMRIHLRQDVIGCHAAQAVHVLTRDELDWLSKWRSAPQGAAHILSWAASHLGVDPQREQVLQELVGVFIDRLGGCERILRTPLPTAYTRHTSRFLLVYVSMAPILLWPTTGWATPVLAAFIAFLLMGTENIGVQIEEPFKVLPLDAICNGIETSIKDMEMQHYGSSSMQHPIRAVDERGSEDKHMCESQQAAHKLQMLLVGELDMPFSGLNRRHSRPLSQEGSARPAAAAKDDLRIDVLPESPAQHAAGSTGPALMQQLSRIASMGRTAGGSAPVQQHASRRASGEVRAVWGLGTPSMHRPVGGHEDEERLNEEEHSNEDDRPLLDRAGGADSAAS